VLRPWNEFPSVQQGAFDEVYNTLHPLNDTSSLLFSPLHQRARSYNVQCQAGRSLAKMIPNHSIYFNYFNTSRSKTLLQMSSLSLAENHQYDEDLALGQGVTFENHILTLSDMAKDVRTRPHLSSSSSNPRRTRKPIHVLGEIFECRCRSPKYH